LQEISNPGQLDFENSEVGVAKEANRLHNEGIKILIAVGHAGYDVDQKVALVPYIDAVVGGHTNTFLYHGKQIACCYSSQPVCMKRSFADLKYIPDLSFS